MSNDVVYSPFVIFDLERNVLEFQYVRVNCTYLVPIFSRCPDVCTYLSRSRLCLSFCLYASFSLHSLSLGLGVLGEQA